MKSVIILILLIIIVIGFWFISQISQETDISPMSEGQIQKVTFTSSDGVEIVGNHYVPGGEVRGVLLLLHMMPAVKESWDALARALQAKGMASLAIDLRGHGESTSSKVQGIRGKDLDYREFSDVEHRQSKLDVEAALEWLEKETNVGLERISVVGASIGANLALQALAEHPEIRKGVALSPGLNYRGIEAKPLVQSMDPRQEVLYATSKDDGDNAVMTQELYEQTSAQKEFKVYDTAGHGTTMLERSDDLIPSIIEFVLR